MLRRCLNSEHTMKIATFFAVLFLIPAVGNAQFGNGEIVFDVQMFGRQLQQLETEIKTAEAEITELKSGLAGGFAPNLALIGELQNYVQQAQGLSLNLQQIQTQYPALFPGYTTGTGARPDSPEQTTAVTLGTLKGTLQSAASQLDSLDAESSRLQTLEAESGSAVGGLKAQEVSNEIGLFNAEQDMKIRQAINAQLNAIAVVEADRVNQDAQDQLEGLAIVGEHSQWDASNDPNPPEPPHIYTGSN